MVDRRRGVAAPLCRGHLPDERRRQRQRRRSQRHQRGWGKRRRIGEQEITKAIIAAAASAVTAGVVAAAATVHVGLSRQGVGGDQQQVGVVRGHQVLTEDEDTD